MILPIFLILVFLLDVMVILLLKRRQYPTYEDLSPFHKFPQFLTELNTVNRSIYHPHILQFHLFRKTR